MIIWIPIWFSIVICVTTLNKTFFTSMRCSFPISITMVSSFGVIHVQVHMISCSIYTTAMKYLCPSFYKYRPLKQAEIKNLVLVSVIFIVNIVLSNSSLKYNSLALDQVGSGSFLKRRCSDVQCQCLHALWSS